MRVGFLVGSVFREAGGLFQSVRGLAKAVASTNANVQVFGIRDEQSAVDLQEWQPLSAGAALRVGPTPEEIADGLRSIIQMSDDDRKTMGARGRDLVATKFSWPRIGEQMRVVYEWMLLGGEMPNTVQL
jgi:hypothetical protein